VTSEQTKGSSEASLVAVVEMVARALADNPDLVSVEEVQRRSTTVLQLTTAQEDIGKIIGRQGRTVSALRTLVSLAAEHQGTRATLDIKD